MQTLPSAPKHSLKPESPSAPKSTHHHPRLRNSPMVFAIVHFGALVFCIVALHLCGGCGHSETPGETRALTLIATQDDHGMTSNEFAQATIHYETNAPAPSSQLDPDIRAAIETQAIHAMVDRILSNQNYQFKTEVKHIKEAGLAGYKAGLRDGMFIERQSLGLGHFL